ncbi:MAG: TonB-dependent receptor [Agriterribacter sp.]
MKNNWLHYRGKLPAAYLKVFIAMKLTFLLILLNVYQVTARVNAQDKVTLTLDKATIGKILNTIEDQGYYRFVYNSNLKDLKQKISIDVRDAAITDVLKNILSKTGLLYNILSDNLIVIRENEVRQDIIVTGTVMDANAAPLAGVSVTVKGTSQGVTTDANGKFSISAPEKGTLVFSFVGFQTQEVAVNNQTEINVSLTPSTTQQLSEVVVIGYGTASKRDLTGSIVKIAGKDVADKPNVNPVSSLQSKVTGLSIVNDGRPGEDPDIRIRGTISIGSVHPLYVVDGMLNDDIKFLNPNDIESIEILKDPSSLAIFGVRGAAGVIIITTKRAKTGQVVVNVNSTFGTKSLVDPLAVANAEQFKMLLNEEANNRVADNPGDLGLRTFIDNHLDKWTANTDWQKEVTRRAIFNTNNISVASSTDRNKFYMGVGFSRDEGLVKHVRLDKTQLSINDEYKINKAIKVGFNINASKEKLPFGTYENEASGLFSDARRIAPIVQPYYPEQDLYSVLPNIQQTLANPMMVLENKWNRTPADRYRVVSNLYAEVTFLKNFTARATWYGDWSNQRNVRYTPIYNGYNPDGANGAPSIDKVSVVTKVADDRYDIKKWQQDYQLTYKKDFGNHGLTLTYVFETYYKSYNKLHGQVEQKANGDPIPDDKRFWNIDNGFGDPSSRVATSSQYEQATVSHLGRLLYNYNGKYFLNVSYRRDGSYAFYKNGNAYDNFYAFGAAWDLTEENFMKGQNLFDYFKIKGSWGRLGNQTTYNEINNYPLYPALLANVSPIFGQYVYPAYSQAYLPDPNLHWEISKSYEAGFEFNMLSNRLHFEAVYFNKRTEGFIVQVPGIAGAQPGLSNSGDMENKGFEIAASWNHSINKDWSYSVSANVTTLKNKVLKLSNTGYKLAAGETNPNQTEAGYPIAYFYGFVTDGVYQNQAEVDAMDVSVSGAEPLIGDVRFKDINGDKKITDNDRTMIGNPTPDLMFGGSIGVNYKGFNLGIDIGGVAGNEIYRVWGTSENQFSLYNYAADKLERWHGEGTSNRIPILNNGRKINRLPSTLGIESGTYWRIRNLQLGYNFPASALSRLYIKQIRLFVNVQNLKTFKKNSGYSPEFGGVAENAAIAFGIDDGNAQGAIPRIFTGGINVTF